jgi:chromosome segregation ATPase
MEVDLFPAKKPAAPPDVQRVQESVTELASRLSVLEERITNLRRKGQVTEQNLIEHVKETRADLRAFSETLTDLARRVEDLKEKTDAIAGELNTVVKKPEFMVLERYMEFWQPMQFVTREEAKLLLEEFLGKDKTA